MGCKNCSNLLNPDENGDQDDSSESYQIANSRYNNRKNRNSVNV